jgi:H+-transporting ATPase
MKPDTDQPKAPGPNPGASAEPKPGSSASKSGPKLEAKPDPKDDLKTLPMPEVEKKLESSVEGLTQAEAQKRLAQYGPNEIEEKKTNLFLKFLSYFWGPIP